LGQHTPTSGLYTTPVSTHIAVSNGDNHGHESMLITGRRRLGPLGQH